MKKILFVLGMIVGLGVSGQWSELGGTNISTFNHPINSILKDSFGNIYAAGDFTNAMGYRYVAKWDGSNWSELGGANTSIFNDQISSLIIGQMGAIYVCGAFKNSNGNYYVAKWDGVSWSELGGTNSSTFNYGIESIIEDITGYIYAAGGFTNAMGKKYVAKWDGNNWSELGGANNSTFNNSIRTIITDNIGNIYAGGLFNNVVGWSYVAMWNGSVWSQLWDSINNTLGNGTTLDMITDAGGYVYIAYSRELGFKNKDFIAKWDGNSWSELGGVNVSTFNDEIQIITTDIYGQIYAGGIFTNLGGRCVAKWNGISWSKLGGSFNGGVRSITTDTIGNIYAAGLFTNNSGKWYVAKYTKPLPLNFLSFTTQLQQNNVALNWHTTNEINVSHFNIQRSNNGKDFTTIDKVNAKSVSSYSFLDEIPTSHLPPTIYYKLEIVDNDGSKTYSEIKQIRLNELTDKRINIYPNPAKTFVNIECAGVKEITITDYLGRTIQQFNHPTEHQTLNTKQFPKGVYMIKATMNNGEIKTEKLVVE